MLPPQWNGKLSSIWLRARAPNTAAPAMTAKQATQRIVSAVLSLLWRPRPFPKPTRRKIKSCRSTPKETARGWEATPPVWANHTDRWGRKSSWDVDPYDGSLRANSGAGRRRSGKRGGRGKFQPVGNARSRDSPLVRQPRRHGRAAPVDTALQRLGERRSAPATGQRRPQPPESCRWAAPRCMWRRAPTIWMWHGGGWRRSLRSFQRTRHRQLRMTRLRIPAKLSVFPAFAKRRSQMPSNGKERRSCSPGYT